jgi:hypothetical protein
LLILPSHKTAHSVTMTMIATITTAGCVPSCQLDRGAIARNR